MTCPVYADQQVDAGPDCCDLSCEWRPVEVAYPDRWEGDDS